MCTPGHHAALLQVQRCLTPRSSGPPTACRLGREAVLVIIGLAAKASRRWRPFNSNVRLRKDMNSGDVMLRPAKPGEELALAELRVRAMRESLEAIGRFDPIRARTRFLESFVPTETHHIVVENQDVGFVVIRAQGETLTLEHLYIHPRQQSRGIGTAVMNLLQEQATERQQSIRVGALKGSRSNQFYQRHGFRPVTQGEWDNYYVYYVWHAKSAA